MAYDLGTDPTGAPWDIDLHSSGSGWTGTFAALIRHVVSDLLLSDGAPFKAEVTLADGTALYGVVEGWQTEHDFTVTATDELPRIVEVDDVIRFRA